MSYDLSVSRCGLVTRMLRVRPLAAFAICTLLGALLALQANLPCTPLVASFALLILGCAISKAAGWRGAVAMLVASGLFLGSGLVTLRLQARPDLENRYDVAISGTLQGIFQLDGQEKRLVCTLGDVTIDGQPEDYSFRLYLRGDMASLAALEAGQRMKAVGHVWAAQAGNNPDQFDFGEFLWQNGMAGYVTANVSDATFAPASPSFSRLLCRLRKTASRRVEDLFPQNAALAKALILGDRDDMNEELTQQFRSSGVAHLLAISGMHVSVLASMLAFALGRFLPRKLTFGLVLACLMAYGAVIGWRASMLRAIAMYAIMGYAPITGRASDPLTRISAAFLLLFFLNPLSIADAGFGLSFCASGGILLLSTPLYRALHLRRLRGPSNGFTPFSRLRKWIAGMIAATLAAQLATTPLVLANYGAIPLFATVSNLLAVPLTLFAYGIGFTAALLSCFPPVAIPLAWISDHLLSALVWTLGICAKLPLNTLRISAPPFWVGVLFGALTLLCSDICALSRRVRAWLLLSLPGCIALCALLAFLGSLGCKIVFLDAGQADAAVIYAQGNAYMIDVGDIHTPAGDYLSGSNTRLNAVFLTHPHADHAGGLASVFSATIPETLYIPAGWYGTDADEGIDETIALAEDMGVSVIELSAGDVVPLSREVSATVLHPEDGAEYTDANELSMVLYVEYGQSSALFTGDLPQSAEPDVLPRASVLKTPHHGAKNAASLWMAWNVSPAIAVISVGQNQYGHPAEETLNRLQDVGAKIFRTDRDGAITLRLLKNGGIIVRTEVAS